MADADPRSAMAIGDDGRPAPRGDAFACDAVPGRPDLAPPPREEPAEAPVSAARSTRSEATGRRAQESTRARESARFWAEFPGHL